MKTITLLINTMLMGTTSAWAFTLNDAWQAAREHSSELKQAQYQFQAYEQQKPIARAALLPQVSVSASHQRQNQFEPRKITQDSSSWKVSASQTIFNLSKWRKYQQSKTIVDAAGKQLDLAEQQLLLKVAESYFNVLVAKESLTTVQKSKEAFAAQQTQAEALFKKGLSTIVDVQEAQAGYESALADEIEITSQLVQAYAQLQTYTGLNPEQIELIKVHDVSQFPNQTSEQWLEQADANNAEIRLQRLVMQSSEQDMKATKANRYPTVEMSAGYYTNPNDYQSTDTVQDYETRANYIGIGISMPLYTGGQLRAQSKQANASYHAAEQELQMTQEKVALSVKENFAKVRAGKIRIQALDKLVQTNQTKVKSSKLGNQYGFLSNADRVRSEKEYYEAELKRTRARYQYLMAQLSLMQLVGLLNDENTIIK